MRKRRRLGSRGDGEQEARKSDKARASTHKAGALVLLLRDPACQTVAHANKTVRSGRDHQNVGSQLGIGDFTEDGRAMGSAGGGEV